MSVYVHLLGIPLLQDRFHLRIRRLGVTCISDYGPRQTPCPHRGLFAIGVLI